MPRPVPAVAWAVLAARTGAGVAATVATPLIPAARLLLARGDDPPEPPATGGRPSPQAPLPPLAPLAPRKALALRPALRFPAGIGARVRSLAAAGVVTLIAQDASVAVVIVLANSRGGSGALVLYSFAWAVFFLPYALLALPLATTALPHLSARPE